MTSPRPDGSRADAPVGRPGPRWEAGEVAPPASTGLAIDRPVRAAKLPRIRPEDAGFRRRIGAWLIDELARTLFYPLLLIVLVMFGGQVPEAPAPGDLSVTAILPQMVLRVGLSWIFWSLGTSPGAMLLHLRIVDGSGRPPGPVRGGVRAIVEVLSISTLLIGFAWALFSRRRQTWHDLAAGTYVVDAPERDLRN